MTELEISIKVRLSCQRALLGIVTPNTRMITIGWDDLRLFHLRAYFSIPPSEEEIEDINNACGEIIADIPYEHDKVECIHDIRIRKDLEVLKWVVYARKE